MRQYKQLTEDDRIEIYAMKQAGNSQAHIAQYLGVHPSTISRELARYTGRRGYRPKQAHRLTTERRYTARKAVKMTRKTIAYIEAQIRQEHAPEQIAGRMKAKGFDFSSPEEVMQEIAAVTPSYGGISFKRLEYGSLQWPCPTEDHPGTPILHAEKFPTDTGKGKFKPLAYRKSAEVPDAEFPLILTTDRSLYHFHGTMTRRVYGLNILEKGIPMEVADIEFTYHDDTQYSGFQVSRDPGNVLIWIASSLFLIGIIMVFYFVHRQTWILVQPLSPGTSRVFIRLSSSRGFSNMAEFNKLIKAIKKELPEVREI